MGASNGGDAGVDADDGDNVGAGTDTPEIEEAIVRAVDEVVVLAVEGAVIAGVG